ncbi:MAG: hypothetical protein HZA52_19275 [Planctomycetes bacterium]|nr:hypothetical protein [Planctomycetota bacterium]
MLVLADLWLPIVVAAVFVFVASSVVHMVLPIHKNDFAPLPDETKVLEALRPFALKPGGYRFPACTSMKDMQSPEMLEKLRRGPVGMITVFPNGPMAMGKALGQWFVFCLVVATFAAYLGGFSLPRGAEFMTVFRVTTTVAFVGFALSSVTDSIWKGVSWGVTAKFVLDGAIYALAAGAAFGWLWPDAAA